MTAAHRDQRLAAALVIHHRSGNPAGLREIVRETAETERGSELLMSILDLHRIYIAETRNNVGVNYLDVYVQDLGAIQPVDPPDVDLQRATRILDCHGRDDWGGINQVIGAARAENRCTQTLLALLDLYAVALPELSSTAGKKWLDNCVAALHAEEAKDE
jgi:hypothetical protein